MSEPGPGAPHHDEHLPVAAVLLVHLAEPAAPALVEAALIRAMADAAPPIAAELAPLPLRRPTDPAQALVLTYAAVLRRAGNDPDRVLADARKAGKRRLRRAFGPATRVVVRAADDGATAAACLRALVGDPRVPHDAALP
jgi:hypothetical protein